MSLNLVNKRVRVFDPYFLQFFHPTFSIVRDLEQPIDYTQGVIYTGTITERIITSLRLMTQNKFILVSSYGDINLTTPEEILQAFYPDAKNINKFKKYDLETFIPQFKRDWIIGRPVSVSRMEDTCPNIYGLYKSILSNKQEIIYEYFSAIERYKLNVVAACLFTYISRVQTMNIAGCKPAYISLIGQANTRFGRKIKPAIQEYIQAEQRPDVALLNLLLSLNEV